jgi:hypothetical protein
LASLASFQLRAFAAEPFQWRIHGAADLVEILGRPVFAVHTEMPECAASFFAVSGLRGHTDIFTSGKKNCDYQSSISVVNNLTGFTIESIGRTAGTLAGKT